MQKMSNIVNRRDGLISDLMKMIATGSSSDVKIVLEDGEICANKDVLSARCAYFATCFSNNKRKFIEGETNAVNFGHCSKAIMEKIIKYLFSGDMKLHGLLLADLLKMMNMTKMLMLDDLLKDIQKFVLRYIKDSGVNPGTLPELVNGLILAEQFKLEITKDALVRELFRSLEDIPHIPDVALNSEAFKTLPVNLVKDILLNDVSVGVVPSTKERFDSFVFWLTENECIDDDKRNITDSFTFDAFTVEELLTDVRSSGLYSIKRIDRRVLEIHQSVQRNLELTGEKLKDKTKALNEKEYSNKIKEKSLTFLTKQIKDKDDQIARKDSLLSSRDKEIRKKNKEIKKLSNKIKECDCSTSSDSDD